MIAGHLLFSILEFDQKQFKIYNCPHQDNANHGAFFFFDSNMKSYQNSEHHNHFYEIVT